MSSLGQALWGINFGHINVTELFLFDLLALSSTVNTSVSCPPSSWLTRWLGALDDNIALKPVSPGCTPSSVFRLPRGLGPLGGGKCADLLLSVPVDAFQHCPLNFQGLPFGFGVGRGRGFLFGFGFYFCHHLGEKP